MKDFQSKQPTKTEKILSEMIMRQEMADRSLWTNSAFLSALAILTDASPEKIAEMLVNGNDKIKEYSGKINDEINRLEKIKQEQASSEQASTKQPNPAQTTTKEATEVEEQNQSSEAKDSE